jgi:HD superfamily phosphodiesterase
MKEDISQSLINILESEFREQLQLSPFVSDAHNIDHIHRVWDHCRNLGVLLDADMDVLTASAYLHDLGRHHVRDKAHGVLSAKLAEPILEKIRFPKEKIAATLHAICVHDVTFQNKDRTTLESKILFDSDKLDSFGTIGVVRNILVYYGKEDINFILDELESKWNELSLDQTREYAKHQYEYITDFFTNLKHEIH